MLSGLRLGAVAVCLVCTLALSTPAPLQEVGVAARGHGAEISVFRLERHVEDYLKRQARNDAAHADFLRHELAASRMRQNLRGAAKVMVSQKF
ncbi:hypothetical protein [Aromatoleum petrolei]|uniref:Uncharacterized protein n=1 Tax=Aromatoleum petrolei TaxID=76116 RepID=A0ABX1MXZ5_9RHOO|nr:hypothetical protein [Aromatoleum petrolei]NMF91438.1 hypothetical protein [Aromatoleum petrolei]